MKPSDIVTVDFPGITGIKRRPAVVISTLEYHRHRPDMIFGILTSQIEDAKTPMDHVLQDRPISGLRRPSAFRSFFVTLPAAAATHIGECSKRDWQAIQICLKRAVAVNS